MQKKGYDSFEILINPSASSGRGMRVWKKVKKELDARGVPYRKHLLQAPGEATLLVRDLTKDLKEDLHLLVLGGDGTLNEVLDGIQDFKHTILSCIRTGSGNDFAGNVGVEKDTQKALAQLLDHPMEAALDYGLIRADEHEPRRFLISCGMGYDADICEEVSRSRLKKALNRVGLGKLVYLLIGVKQIFTRGDVDAMLYLDDKKPLPIHRLFFVVGMQHPREGGGVPFCPDADPTDDLMDLCLVRDMPKWKLMLGVALVYFKKHLIFRNITCQRCRTMRLVADKPQWVHLDGETPYQAKEVLWAVKGKVRYVK
ncbi:MAG: diacylglycerol kinase family lipid kinase [Lachnospiraceae bacterium]|nr:diacylglycerol kinase family lipid kinase [Lachnospiraceae bacterium]